MQMPLTGTQVGHHSPASALRIGLVKKSCHMSGASSCAFIPANTANSLGITTWQSLSPLPDDGTMKVLTDPAATVPQRFYRIRQN
jgi:hypothetical protein